MNDKVVLTPADGECLDLSGVVLGELDYLVRGLGGKPTIEDPEVQKAIHELVDNEDQ